MKLTLVLPIHRFALLTVKLVSVISIVEIRIGNANFRDFRAVIFLKANAKHSRMPIKMRWFLFVVLSCVSLEVKPVEIVFSLFSLASLISLKILGCIRAGIVPLPYPWLLQSCNAAGT